MALSVEQLTARRAWIGSSDVPAILGVDPYKSIVDVWAEKRGLVDAKVTSNPAADWGDRMEPLLVQWIGEHVGEEPERGHVAKSPDGVLRAQLDGWLAFAGETIEIKTAGLFNAMFRPDEEGWGAGGTDHLPYRVLAQTQFAMLVSGAPRCHVGAFLGNGVGPRHYLVEADRALQMVIETRARGFWTDYVLTGRQPEGVPSLETLTSFRREPGKTVTIPEDLVDAYEEATATAKAAADAKDAVKRDILHALGDAEVGITPIGTFTYYANAKGVRTLRLANGGTR